jgi:hypothetical protein
VDTIRRALPVTDDKDIPIDIRMEAVMDTYRTINSNGKQLLVEYTSIIENEKDVFPEIVGILQEKRDTLKKILEKLSKFEDLYTKKEYTEEELSRFEDTNKENIDEFRKIIKWNDLLSYISMYRNLKNNLSEIEVLLESTRELDREKLQGYREQIMDHIANILVNLGEFIKNSNLTIISRHLTVLQLLDDNIFDFLDEIKKRGGSKKERVYKKISKQNKSQKNNNKYTRRSSIIFKRGKLKTKNKK